MAAFNQDAGGVFRFTRRHDLESSGYPFLADLHIDVHADEGRRNFDLSRLTKGDLLIMRKEINRALKEGTR